MYSHLSELLEEVGLASKLLKKLKAQRFDQLDLLKEVVWNDDRYTLELIRSSCGLAHSDVDKLTR